MHASECHDGLQVLGQYHGAWDSFVLLYTVSIRGFDKLAGGSRILRRLQSHSMGSEGPAFGGARIGFVWGGHSEAIITGHQAASWVVSADSSCTSRRDTVDVVTHHRQTGIDNKGLHFIIAYSHFSSSHMDNCKTVDSIASQQHRFANSVT
jgi:hypothetical protein